MARFISQKHASVLLHVTQAALSLYIKRNNPDFYNCDTRRIDTSSESWIAYANKRKGSDTSNTRSNSNTKKDIDTPPPPQSGGGGIPEIDITPPIEAMTDNTDIYTEEKKYKIEKIKAEVELKKIAIAEKKMELVNKDMLGKAVFSYLEVLNQELLDGAEAIKKDIMSMKKLGNAQKIEEKIITHMGKIIKKAKKNIERVVK